MKKYNLKPFCFGGFYFQITSKKVFKILAFLVCLALGNAKAIAQDPDFCGTYGGGPKSVGKLAPGACSPSPNGPFYIKTYVHVLKRISDGALSQDATAITNAYDILANQFNPHNIFFVWDCEIIEIPVSDLDFVDPSLYCSLFYGPLYQYDD